jgi:hypothetical protein
LPNELHVALYIKEFGYLGQKYRQPKSSGNINGYGFMVSFVPNQGKQKEWLLPKVNTKIFSQVLEDFAKNFSISLR